MHQKCSIGNLTMMHYLLRYYLNPTDFNMLIYTTQCLQGDYQEMVIRHLRSHRERCGEAPTGRSTTPILPCPGQPSTIMAGGRELITL